MTDTWHGGCQCGAVSYALIAAEVMTLVCCHCRDCQRQSSSAFGMSLILPRSAFTLAQGDLRTWRRPTDRGTVSGGHFCPVCGVRIYHEGGADSALISVKAGTLDDTSRLAPVAHLWTKRAQTWLALDPDLLHYAGEPESDEPLYGTYRSRTERAV